MVSHPIVSKSEWLAARTALLAQEKAFTRERDRLSEARRALPWVKVDKDYVFEGKRGKLRLADLFGPHRQLIVYHFMFGPDWEAGCKSCSFYKDDGSIYHTYSCYSRGLDMLIGAYNHLDLVPKGRDEASLAYTMEWVRLHDEYGK